MKANLKNITLQILATLSAVSTIASSNGSVAELWAKSLEAEADGDYVYALEHHAHILPMVGKSYTASLRAGWLYYMNAEYSMALKNYVKASGMSSGALAPLCGAMNCHIALGDNARAVKVAKAILVIDENNYTATAQLAALYYQERKFSLATAYYRKLNRLYPEDLAVASGLAWSYLEQGETRQAVPLFNTILMISPDYAYAERGLSICKQISNR